MSKKHKLIKELATAYNLDIIEADYNDIILENVFQLIIDGILDETIAGYNQEDRLVDLVMSVFNLYEEGETNG